VAFGLAAVLGGSGFLAVDVAGIVLGSSSLVSRRSIFSFHDATAWLGQIVLFVMLGLLSFPSRLLAVAWEGLLIAMVLILVARPCRWSSTPCGRSMGRSSITPSKRAPTRPARGCVNWPHPMASSSP